MPDTSPELAEGLKPTNVVLRDILESDLSVFYGQQLDPEATQMAAYPPKDEDAFAKYWHRNLAANARSMRTILADALIAGNIASWEAEGQQEVGYWLGREYWGKGIATEALALFLRDVMPVRPLYAYAVRDNVGSMRVLEKNGFVLTGYEPSFSDQRGCDVEYAIYRLDV